MKRGRNTTGYTYDTHLMVRITKEQSESLKIRAAEAGLDTSDYVRSLLEIDTDRGEVNIARRLKGLDFRVSGIRSLLSKLESDIKDCKEELAHGSRK